MMKKFDEEPGIGKALHFFKNGNALLMRQEAEDLSIGQWKTCAFDMKDTLNYLTREAKQVKPEDLGTFYSVKQLKKAMIPMQDKKIVHCDIKPENLLVNFPYDTVLETIYHQKNKTGKSCEKNGQTWKHIQLPMQDFGEQIEEKTEENWVKGTEGYQAPEISLYLKLSKNKNFMKSFYPNANEDYQMDKLKLQTKEAFNKGYPYSTKIDMFQFGMSMASIVLDWHYQKTSLKKDARFIHCGNHYRVIYTKKLVSQARKMQNASIQDLEQIQDFIKNTLEKQQENLREELEQVRQELQNDADELQIAEGELINYAASKVKEKTLDYIFTKDEFLKSSFAQLEKSFLGKLAEGLGEGQNKQGCKNEGNFMKAVKSMLAVNPQERASQRDQLKILKGLQKPQDEPEVKMDEEDTQNLTIIENECASGEGQCESSDSELTEQSFGSSDMTESVATEQSDEVVIVKQLYWHSTQDYQKMKEGASFWQTIWQSLWKYRQLLILLLVIILILLKYVFKAF